MKVIGITGRSGSGKSTLSAALANKGAAVLDGDSIAASIMEPGSPLLKSVHDAFGDAYFNADGSLDRGKLGSLVFSNSRSLALLNSIVHPAFREKIRQMILDLERSKSRPDYAVIDAAVLYESGLDEFCDLVVAVFCDEMASAERIAKRDGIEPEKALSRIKAQKAKLGDYRMSRLADVNVISRGDPAEMDMWANRILRIAGGK